MAKELASIAYFRRKIFMNGNYRPRKPSPPVCWEEGLAAGEIYRIAYQKMREHAVERERLANEWRMTLDEEMPHEVEAIETFYDRKRMSLREAKRALGYPAGTWLNPFCTRPVWQSACNNDPCVCDEEQDES